MLSVKCGPFLYDLFCCLGVKEARSPVAGLDTGAEIVCQSKFIMIGLDKTESLKCKISPVPGGGQGMLLE